jgi:hypothetical protein
MCSVQRALLPLLNGSHFSNQESRERPFLLPFSAAAAAAKESKECLFFIMFPRVFSLMSMIALVFSEGSITPYIKLLFMVLSSQNTFGLRSMFGKLSALL